MKRAGSKSAQIVRSASRRKKTASRFQFDIVITSISGLRPKSSYVIKLTRGIKVATTEAFTIPADGGGKSGFELGHTLPLPVTLYREDGKPFDPKEAKLSVVPANLKRVAKPVAKGRFDLSQYAGVPTKSVQEVLKLSDKISLRVTINSRFLKAGESGPGSDASSAVSGLSGVGSEQLSDEDDEFGDLLLDDIPEPEQEVVRPSKQPIQIPTKSAVPPTPTSISPTSSGITRPSISRNISGVTSSTVSEDAHRVAAPPLTSPMRRSNSPKLNSPSSYNQRQRAVQTVNSTENVTFSRNSADEELITALKSEKDHLSSKLDQALRKLDNLEAERRKQVDELTAKVTRLITEADETSRQRDQLRAEHRRERAELQKQLEERVRQVGDLRALQDVGDNERTKMKEENVELNLSVEELKAELKIVKNASADSKLLEERQAELEQSVKELTFELVSTKRERDDLQSRARRLQNTEAKCKQLSREVDRLAVLSAKSKDSGDENASDEVERRISTLRDEKEKAEKKRNVLQAHIKGMEETYNNLQAMYEKLRESDAILREEIVKEREAHKIALQNATKEATEKAMATAREVVEDPVVKDDDEKNILVEELEDARQQLREMGLKHETLIKDEEEKQSQVDSLQQELDETLHTLDQSQEEIERLYEEVEDLKGQRDKALTRALSKGKESPVSSDNNAAKAVQEELRSSKERFGKEQDKLTQRVRELESEISDLREDLEFEKSEKAKAREERDKIRESARALERRTSQAVRVTDAMHSMRRQLSAQQMREQDQDSIISHLKEEVSSLRAERDEAKRISQSGLAPNGEEIHEVLNALVVAKLAVAEAQSEKQELEFKMRQLKKNESFKCNRLAEKVTRLEDELTETKEELERLQKQRSPRRNSEPSEFTELGSDVDY